MKNLFFIFIFAISFNEYCSAQESVSKFYIVTWDEWGRASKKCKSWGLCNAEWFHCSPDPCFGKSTSSPLFFDVKNNQYYLDIKLDEETIAKYSNENLEVLPVDEDIILYTKNLINKDLIIKKGEYKLNRTTNSYRVNLYD